MVPPQTAENDLGCKSIRQFCRQSLSKVCLICIATANEFLNRSDRGEVFSFCKIGGDLGRRKWELGYLSGRRSRKFLLYRFKLLCVTDERCRATVVIMHYKRVKSCDKDVRLVQMFDSVFMRFDPEQFSAKIIRDRKNCSEYAGEFFVQGGKSLIWIIIRNFNFFNWINARDQQMRAEMADAATVKNADRFGLGKAKQCCDQIVRR